MNLIEIIVSDPGDEQPGSYITTLVNLNEKFSIY
tara:strand:+ start:1797 stop:1898 length:102 start_codon:yes stop_codon:yes gene_type:complete